MPDPTIDITDLLHDIDPSRITYIAQSDRRRYHAAIQALVAERDAFKARIAELKAHPPADRDLRERLVCAALTGLLAHPSDSHPMHDLRELAVYSATAADLTLAAMRKGGGA